MQYNALKYSTTKYSVAQRGAGIYSAVKCSTVHYVFRLIVALHSFRLKLCSDKCIVQCSTLHYSAVQCSTVQYSAVQCSKGQTSVFKCSTVRYRAIQSRTVQHSAIQ